MKIRPGNCEKPQKGTSATTHDKQSMAQLLRATSKRNARPERYGGVSARMAELPVRRRGRWLVFQHLNNISPSEAGG